MTTIALRSFRVKSVAPWTAQIGAAAMFFLAGTLKLSGAEPMVHVFAAVGLGQWFRYLTGAIEVGSAVLLLIPSLSFYGAALLVPTMIGAVLTHLFIIGGNPAMPFALLAASAWIAFERYSEKR